MPVFTVTVLGKSEPGWLATGGMRRRRREEKEMRRGVPYLKSEDPKHDGWGKCLFIRKLSLFS